MVEIIQRPSAIRDLQSITDDLVDRAGLKVALSFQDAVRSTYAELSASPNIGAERDFIGPLLKNLRMWRVPAFPKYLIFYEVTGFVEIIRILHGSRNLNRLFQQVES